jgi:hypothetical protein
MYATAQSVEIGGLKYYLYADTYKADVASGNIWSGELIIPSEITYDGQAYEVNGISCVAFLDSDKLTKVRLPRTIKSITPYVYNNNGRTAVSPFNMNPFVRCISLESIDVDDENPSFCSIDGVLFNKEKTQLCAYPAGLKRENYTIPEDVTFIGQGAFAYNYYISNLTMPNSVTNMYGHICSNCTNLKTIKLSERITFIDSFSFEKCESLQLLDIPESVSLLGGGIIRWSGIKTLIIRGTFPQGVFEETFYDVDNELVVYVQPSEIEKFKQVFSGTVLPLDEYTGIDKINKDRFSSNPLFDLQGRRLNGKPAKGMYIQNGKKYVK